MGHSFGCVLKLLSFKLFRARQPSTVDRLQHSWAFVLAWSHRHPKRSMKRHDLCDARCKSTVHETLPPGMRSYALWGISGPVYYSLSWESRQLNKNVWKILSCKAVTLRDDLLMNLVHDIWSWFNCKSRGYAISSNVPITSKGYFCESNTCNLK